MKRMIMTLAIAGALLGFSLPGQPAGLPLGPSQAQAGEGSGDHYRRGGDYGHHQKHRKKSHRKHHKKHHGKHHYGHGGKHHNGDHGGHRSRNHLKHAYGYGRKHYRQAGCHPISKEGYWYGRYGLIGGTMCYNHYGRGYVVDGSRYLIHYY